MLRVCFTPFSIDLNLRVSLQLMTKFVNLSPPGMVQMSNDMPRPILYTDASDVPERRGGQIRPGSSSSLWGNERKDGIHLTGTSSRPYCHMGSPAVVYGTVGTLGGPLALATWPAVLHHTKLFHFIDNDSAAACLVKGYSPQVDSSRLWRLLAESGSCGSRCLYRQGRVEIQLGDGPSRLDYQVVHSLGGKIRAAASRIFDSYFAFLFQTRIGSRLVILVFPDGQSRFLSRNTQGSRGGTQGLTWAISPALLRVSGPPRGNHRLGSSYGRISLCLHNGTDERRS